MCIYMCVFITIHRAPSVTVNCPHRNPVCDIGSPRGLWHRDAKLRVLVEGVLLGRGAALRALLATCAPGPCASKVRRKPEAFPLRGLSLSRTERVRGVESVGRPVREKYCKLFSVREDQSLYTRVSLHRVKEWVLSGQNRSKQSYHGSLY